MVEQMINPNPENFNTTKPLQPYPRGYSNGKKWAWYLSEFDRLKIEMKQQKLEVIPELLFNIQVPPRTFTKLDEIMVKQGGEELYHKRIVNKILELCPDDVQVLPVTIFNHPDLNEQFENHDYFLLNILHTVNALDEERSTFFDLNDIAFVKRHVFHNDRWDGHLIARDKRSGRVIWHPRLAREFAKSKSIMFLSDDEIIYYNL